MRPQGDTTGPRTGASARTRALSSSASPSSSSAILPGGTQLSSVESGRRGFFRSLAQIGRQVAGGLAYAHARGIVHRDIKPSNLLLDTEGVVWIADFGLAKGDDEGLTQSGDILGTLRYMAPERFRGEGDARADVYALGLTLYELLTLRPGFDSSDRLKLIEQIKTEEPPKPRAVDARIPRDLETIVLKAIEKDPKARYQSAEAMGEDLGRFLADEPIRARRATLTEQTVRWCRRNPAVASLVAAVMLATLDRGRVCFVLRCSRRRAARRSVRSKAVEREREAILARKDAESASGRATIARQAAEESAEEARKRLTRLYVFSGVRYQDDRDDPRGPPLVPPGVGAGPCRPDGRRRSPDADRRGTRRDAGPDRGVFPQDEGLRRRLLAGRTARPHPDRRERGLPVGLRATAGSPPRPCRTPAGCGTSLTVPTGSRSPRRRPTAPRASGIRPPGPGDSP